MLSLRVNKLTGTLPEKWDAPLLEMLLLSDNQLEGGADCFDRFGGETHDAMVGSSHQHWQDAGTLL
jgi:hypothetical protein